MAKHTAEFIDRPEVASRTLAGMATITDLAVDTEGASFHRFVDRIYLLQLTAPSRSVIVDPLAVSAGVLAPLGALLESPVVQKVFHDADYDLRLLYRDYGWHVRNMFDTRVAAQLLGLRAFGLAALLDRYFGVKLDKKHQRADWSVRPLSGDMLDYAAQDTHYLLDLRERMAAELERAGRADWAAEEFARLEGTRWPDEEPGSAFFRIKGARDLTRRELAVFRELVEWRNAVAKTLDRATFRVIGNEQLFDMARTQPRARDAIGKIRGVSRALVDQRWMEIVNAVERGLEIPEADLPRFPRGPRWDRDPRFDARVSALKTVRDEVAQRLDLDPGVLCARDRLEAVARRNPKTRDELLEVSELRRWQADVLGEGFLKGLAGI